MAIRWDDIPHAEIAAAIHMRLGQNAVGRSAEDASRHILSRRLASLDANEHRRFIELESRDLVAHLRCTRDAYREFVEKRNCQPLLEAYWVVLRCAVFPTAIFALRKKVVEYLKLARVPGRDLSLLFGIPTHTLEARLALGDLSFLQTEQPETFAKYVEAWEKQYVDIKPSTAARYKGLLKLHILPFFGAKPLDAITRDDVKRFFSELALKQVQPKSKKPEKIDPERKTLAANSLQNALICLRVIFQSAVEDGLIALNPASKVGRFLPKDREKFEAVFLSRDELEGFLGSVLALSPEHYPLFLTFARTGLRLGEALALRWGDIQFGQDSSDPNRYLWIRRNYTAGRLVTPKSGKSRRVDMSQQLRAVLLDVREQRLLDAMLKGDSPVSEDLVFRSASGGVLDPANLHKRVLLPAIQHAGLRRFRIHDLRHTFASLLIQDGASLAYVKEQLGHSTIAVTVDLYGHLVPSANIAFVDRLDAKTSLKPNATQEQPATEAEELEYSEVFENYGGPGQSRTADQRFRKPLLYPSELQGHSRQVIQPAGLSC
jgi:integrase